MHLIFLSVTPANEWFKRPIYHNAGVTDSMKDMFYKGLYIDELLLRLKYR